jgi:hypothetical protein
MLPMQYAATDMFLRMHKGYKLGAIELCSTLIEYLYALAGLGT